MDSKKTHRVGVLLCDDLHEELRSRWASYMALFEALVNDDNGDLTAVGYRVHAGEWPSGPDAADAWLVTGSRASVHEHPDWLAPLQTLVREIDTQGLPLLGVCFGHQLIHSALGGRTARSPHGWNLGAYPVECEVDFAGLSAGERLHLFAVHQDHVESPAPGFERLATSPRCRWYASRRGRTLTLQGHPEFDHEFFMAIMGRVREKAGDELVDAAIDSLPQQDHTPVIQSFMRSWIRQGAVDSPGAGSASPECG